MEASPRDDDGTQAEDARCVTDGQRVPGARRDAPLDDVPLDARTAPPDDNGTSPDAAAGQALAPDPDPDPDPDRSLDGVAGVDGADPEDPGGDAEAVVEPQELRPQRKLRLWQLAPIVGLGALGSLMFAFPLAFEPGGSSGAVVSMLGLLICGCAAGWGVMAARRVGHTWPGLPPRGSGRRPDWRVVTVYAVVVCTVVVLAVLRVARLRS